LVATAHPTIMFIDSGKLSLSQLAAIQQASKDVLEDATHFLTQLIKIDTTNPPGRNYHEIAVLIKDHLRSLQYDANLLKVAAEGALTCSTKWSCS
jgi:succinyl-diaminopimelate desuccinylase